MRFMILVKATADSEAGAMPTAALLNAMADYHEELAKAGVLVDANGLQPSSKGWRIEWSGGRRLVTDGPFAEIKELIAGLHRHRRALARGSGGMGRTLPEPGAR